MLRQNGGCNVTVAAPGGLKMELARKLGAGDHFVELSRTNSDDDFVKIKSDNPYGFDIVVEVCDTKAQFCWTWLTNVALGHWIR